MKTYQLLTKDKVNSIFGAGMEYSLKSKRPIKNVFVDFEKTKQDIMDKQDDVFDKAIKEALLDHFKNRVENNRNIITSGPHGELNVLIGSIKDNIRTLLESDFNSNKLNPKKLKPFEEIVFTLLDRAVPKRLGFKQKPMAADSVWKKLRENSSGFEKFKELIRRELQPEVEKRYKSKMKMLVEQQRVTQDLIKRGNTPEREMTLWYLNMILLKTNQNDKDGIKRYVELAQKDIKKQIIT